VEVDMVLKKLAIFLTIIFLFANVYCQGQFPDYPIVTLESLVGVEYIIFLQPASGEYMIIIIDDEYYLVFLEN
jgi:hypothetical protein